MINIEEFKTGELITVSEGEYSDYHVNGLFKVLVDFNAQELLIKWAEETKREVVDGKVYADYTNENIEYLGWLNKNGYIADVDYMELHIGSYGETELS